MAAMRVHKRSAEVRAIKKFQLEQADLKSKSWWEVGTIGAL